MGANLISVCEEMKGLEFNVQSLALSLK